MLHRLQYLPLRPGPRLLVPRRYLLPIHHLHRKMYSLRGLDLSKGTVEEEVVQEVVVVSEEELVVLRGIPAAATVELKEMLVVSRSSSVDSGEWWCSAAARDGCRRCNNRGERYDNKIITTYFIFSALFECVTKRPPFSSALLRFFAPLLSKFSASVKINILRLNPPPPLHRRPAFPPLLSSPPPPPSLETLTAPTPRPRPPPPRISSLSCSPASLETSVFEAQRSLKTSAFEHLPDVHVSLQWSRLLDNNQFCYVEIPKSYANFSTLVKLWVECF
ncbi:hypothetical protein Droror1_Dr00018426 [Drosera rotundifolia]